MFQELKRIMLNKGSTLFFSRLKNTHTMKTIQITIGTIITILTLFIVFYHQANATLNTPENPETPIKVLNTPDTDNNSEDAIQIAILLDNSGSMSGLIEQTKSQLWKIVNELSELERNGQTPRLNIGLYTHGDTDIKQISAFTNDLDLISEELFSLGIYGGSEYCGAAIKKSIKELEWSDNPNSLKMIYIAGNESFAQGHIPYRQAISEATERGVVVNTIFCGPAESGLQLEWGEGARLGNGDYTNIDHNKATVYIETPYDDQITQYNQQLNSTYIGYGKQGKVYMQNQAQQDYNASSFSKSNATERAVFKSKKSYDNSKWDLVDAYKKDNNVVNKEKELPKELKGKSAAEVEALVKEKLETRTKIQDNIQELNKKRKAFIAEKRKEAGEEASFEQSIINSVKKQASKKGYNQQGDKKKVN